MKKLTHILTSVNVPHILFDDFRIMAIPTKFSLQKLVERTMFLYVTDPEFKKTINNQFNTYYTGSI